MTALVQLPPANVAVFDVNGQMTDVWYRFFTALVTRAGGVSGALQPEDPTLTALAGMDASAGALVQTGADAFTKVAGFTGTKTPVTSITVNKGIVTGVI